MSDKGLMEKEEIFSKVLRAGRRTYFFDVRATRANEIYLYKEDFAGFAEILQEMTDFILDEKGEEVISERHQKDFKPSYEGTGAVEAKTAPENFTDVSFDDI